MFYRVTAELNFTDQDEANDFYHDCELALLRSKTINPGQEDEERGRITLQKCAHDEHPLHPCDMVDEIETPTG